MSAPERGPLQAALAVAWTVLLITLLLWTAIYVVSQIWGWLVVLAAAGGVVWMLAWWRRSRRDRW